MIARLNYYWVRVCQLLNIILLYSKRTPKNKYLINYMTLIIFTRYIRRNHSLLNKSILTVNIQQVIVLLSTSWCERMNGVDIYCSVILFVIFLVYCHTAGTLKICLHYQGDKDSFILSFSKYTFITSPWYVEKIEMISL